VSPPDDEISVFLCEDIDSVDEAQRELDANRDGRRRLRIVGHADTFDYAKAYLFALDPFPDIVLIDDRLPRGADGIPRQSAIDLASAIYTWRRSADLVPQTRLVLWTSSDDAQLFWTFRVCGGRHIVSKSLTPWAQRTQLLYDVVMKDAEWWPPKPTLRLQPSHRDVIRYFAEGASRADIAAALNISVDTVKLRAGELRRTIVEQRDRQHVPTGEVALATVALQDGWVWVRPKHDGLLPVNPPLPLVLDPEMIPGS
jgi:DNA-binding NarL/FixJ family response regulator